MKLSAGRDGSFLKLMNEIVRFDCLLGEKPYHPLPLPDEITKWVRELEISMAEVTMEHFALLKKVDEEQHTEFNTKYGDLELLYMNAMEKVELRLELIRHVAVVDMVPMRTRLEKKTLLVLQ